MTDQRIIDFLLNAHVTPLGLVDPNHRFKAARIVFDSTFRVNVWSDAINDWTDIANEPPMVFGQAFDRYLIWLWNLRITYPDEEIYVGDDDVSGAFRHVKLHPSLVAMHSFLLNGSCFMSTGMAFGDCFSPPNFDPIAQGRGQHAQHLWQHADVTPMSKYLPKLTFTPTPSIAEKATFRQAQRDALNPGVLRQDGSRLPNPYPHWVDDNLYADIRRFMPRTVYASVYALFDILGFPEDTKYRALSDNKFDSMYTWYRKEVGWWIDTRDMSFSLPADKRKQLLILLSEWTGRTSFDIIEAATLHGVLDNASRCCRWARPMFFALQNEMRKILHTQYHAVARIFQKRNCLHALQAALPTNKFSRLPFLIQQKRAALLWRAKTRFTVNAHLRKSLSILHGYLHDPINPWKKLIGHHVPRSPNVITAGDASLKAGGAVCDDLEFWFEILWSHELIRRINLADKDPLKVHINCLEFIIALLQFAAVCERLQYLPSAMAAAHFPLGTLHLPALLIQSDNTPTKRWANKITTKSRQGQNLLTIFAEMLRLTDVGVNTEWLKGELNTRPDFISRPDLSLSTAARFEQIYQLEPRLTGYSFFLPNPALLSIIRSRLYSESPMGLPDLPKSWGQFVHVESSTFSGLFL